MSLIHNNLYQNKSFAEIELSQYIADFCSYMLKHYRTNTSFEIIEKTEKLFLPIKTAIPCALILNELLTNSFKHSFKKMSVGVIEVGLKKEGDSVLFWISDTGIENIHHGANGIAMDLLSSLVEQIDGKLTYENKKGNKFVIRFESKG